MALATDEHRLVVEHLTKQYGDHTAVDDLTFTVEPGRVTGFLGPNGSGKSTTMKILLDLATTTGPMSYSWTSACPKWTASPPTRPSSNTLYVSAATVKSHVSNILTKLGLRDRAQAVVFAYESVLITPGHHDIGH